MKVRPDEFVTASHKVLNVGEAVANYLGKYGPLTNEAQDYYESDCLNGSCLLEVSPMMTKVRFINLLKG